MRLVILDNAEAVADFACDYFVDQLNARPNSILGLATGSSPVALYQRLVGANQRGEVSFKDVTSFNLDEYIGLAGDHRQSYRHFMNEKLFDHVDIDRARTHVPDGAAADPNAECTRYEQSIQTAGGIDLQLLGIGVNGHIGFNEPLSSLASRTRVKTLTKSTIEANSRYFDADEFQPTDAITTGIGTILDAKEVLLLATGAAKAEAVRGCVEGPITAACPASALQMHQHAIVVVDEDAASLLSMKEYAQWLSSATLS